MNCQAIYLFYFNVILKLKKLIYLLKKQQHNIIHLTLTALKLETYMPWNTLWDHMERMVYGLVYIWVLF